jgi:hypothetical protein
VWGAGILLWTDSGECLSGMCIHIDGGWIMRP